MRAKPEHLFREVFGSKAARDGAVVRRKLRDIEFQVGKEVFLAEVKRRGFYAFENGGQIIVFCNNEPLRRLV